MPANRQFTQHPWKDGLLGRRLAVFGGGLLACVAVGALISVFAGAGSATAVGYTTALLGTLLMLGGGLVGGAYAVGGIGKGVGRYTYLVGDGNDSLLDEMRSGYRPERDAIAFWQVVVGALYLGIGLLVLMTFG